MVVHVELRSVLQSFVEAVVGLGAVRASRAKAKGVPVVVYEPTLDAPDFNGRRGHARPRGVQGRVRRDHRQLLDVPATLISRKRYDSRRGDVPVPHIECQQR